jgi:hypothetical protein
MEAVCCDRSMTLVRFGTEVGFAIGIWRCHICEDFHSTLERYGVPPYPSPRVGEAVHRKRLALIADAYMPKKAM